MYKEELGNSYQDPEESLYESTRTSQDIASSQAFQEAEARNIRILGESMSQLLAHPVQAKEPPRVKDHHLPRYKIKKETWSMGVGPRR